MPLILFHGAADQVVAAANAQRLETQWAAAGARVAGGAGQPVTESTQSEADGRVAHQRAGS
jgi:hypothetical protein